MIKTLCLFVLALALAGCSHVKSNEKRYPMQGTVVSVDPATKSANIDAGWIGDWMAPMAMDYLVKPESELAKLHAGDHIQATVVVSGESYYVTDVKVAPK